eukprot:1752372-Rhodomonas_salina.1
MPRTPHSVTPHIHACALRHAVHPRVCTVLPRDGGGKSETVVFNAHTRVQTQRTGAGVGVRDGGLGR